MFMRILSFNTAHIPQNYTVFVIQMQGKPKAKPDLLKILSTTVTHLTVENSNFLHFI